jgi:hypothetical protein
MRFPANVTRQKQCPVCKKAGPGTRPPATPRPETASLSLVVMLHAPGRSSPVVLGADLFLGWDSGIDRSPRSRCSLGASLRAARREGEDPYGVGLEIQFCSTRCLRQFLMDAVDELERRAEAVAPEVRPARSRQGVGKKRRARRRT